MDKETLCSGLRRTVVEQGLVQSLGTEAAKSCLFRLDQTLPEILPSWRQQSIPGETSFLEERILLLVWGLNYLVKAASVWAY